MSRNGVHDQLTAASDIMGVLWNSGGVVLRESDIPVMLFDSLIHRSASLTDVELWTVESKRRDPPMQCAHRETNIFWKCYLPRWHPYFTIMEPFFPAVAYKQHSFSLTIFSRFFCRVNLNFTTTLEITATHSAFSVSVINIWLLIWTVLFDIISIFSSHGFGLKIL